MMTGKRVLIAEDEAIVADMLELVLQEQGISVVGPAGTVAAALSLAQVEELDAAILDVNLRGELVDPVVEALRSRGVPMIFATGYGTGVSVLAERSIILTKPYSPSRLVGALASCFR
jgi:DNA-binding response OmpR family regulator